MSSRQEVRKANAQGNHAMSLKKEKKKRVKSNNFEMDNGKEVLGRVDEWWWKGIKRK
jgi:hypothetical protein